MEPATLGWRRGQKHVSGHPGKEAPLGVGNGHFDFEGFNVPFGAADVTLGGEVAFHALEKDGAFDCVSGRQANIELLAEADLIDVGLLNVGLHPEMVDIQHGYDGPARLHCFSLACHANRNDAIGRRVNFGIAELRLRLVLLGDGLRQLSAGGGNVSLLDLNLFPVCLGDRQLSLGGALLILQRLHVVL